MVETLTQVVQLIGIPVLLGMLYGPPVLLVVYFCLKDWKFTASIVATQTEIVTLLRSRSEK